MKNNLLKPIALLTFCILLSGCEKEPSSEDPKPDPGFYTDTRDGNRYAILTLGSQTWMAENLRYLPAVHNTTSTTEKRFYTLYYTGTDVEEARQQELYKLYGAFYNLPAALNGAQPTSGDEATPVQGICPEGWHLPTTRDWQMLAQYVIDNRMLAVDADGNPIEEAVAKALASTTDWVFPPDGGSETAPAPGHVAYDLSKNNTTGFNGQPAGFRGVDEEIIWWHGAYSAGWWSSTQGIREASFGMPVRMWSDSIYFSVGYSEFSPGCALPVRCIKN